MTQGGPADSTRTIVYYVYDQAFAELEISYACTLGLALFLVVMLFTLVRLAFSGDRALIERSAAPLSGKLRGLRNQGGMTTTAEMIGVVGGGQLAA